MPQHVATAVAKQQKEIAFCVEQVSMGAGRFWARMSRRSGPRTNLSTEQLKESNGNTALRSCAA
ncbi:hypothetical protein PG993_000301 [Apiospora rasikravindrae]|uniref:Uncharacterized protein n=1 Tax=Apiospora rasikravindrae TaxID=990691 RepID=A0ABR1U876_9PEZI